MINVERLTFLSLTLKLLRLYSKLCLEFVSLNIFFRDRVTSALVGIKLQ